MSLGDCLETFVRGKSSASDIDSQLDLFVHECGHFLDIGLSFSTRRDVYYVTEQLTISCDQYDIT